MGRRSSAVIPLILMVLLFCTTGSAEPKAVVRTGGPYPVYDLSVSFDLSKHLLTGDAKIEISGPVKFFTGNIKVLSVSLNGAPFPGSMSKGWLQVNGKGLLEIRYEKVSGGYETSPTNPGVVSGSVIGKEGISLSGNWYPSAEGLAMFRLTAVVPAGFTAISEADDITSVDLPNGKQFSFSFPHPLGGLDFAAAPYVVTRSSVNGIDVYTYFLPEDAGLAKQYIDYTKKYLAMFEKILVPYPYKRFSVVENLLPTGVSVPTFTLLGAEVLRLPFIVKTSLGHEIGHQWWGNYVYADFSKGNWLEALNSWMTDYRFAKMEGKGLEYRKKALADYQSYVNAGNDFPLRQFYERTDPASAAIGYGKGMMLFHMLKGIVGRDVFYKSLKALIGQYKWKTASWDDIRAVFERESGKDLSWFFKQWLDRKGVPAFGVINEDALVLDGIPQASFELVQAGGPYRVTLPVSVIAGKIEKTTAIQVDSNRHTFQVAAQEKPSRLVVDGNYDVMRSLRNDEFSPSISRLFGSKNRLVVYRAATKNEYSALIDILSKEGFTLKEEKDLKNADIQKSSLLVLGFDSPVLKRLFGRVGGTGKGFMLTVKENPVSPSNVVAMAQTGSKREADLDAYKISHYGQYQTLRFEGGKNMEKKTAESKNGMIYELSKPVPAIRTSSTLYLDNAIEQAVNAPVIFIGERHANYEDHEVELDTVMALHKMGKNKKFAIGMEMFQRPFQKYIDDFIAKKIDEREFLKETEYFTRWGFDYSYYRQILEYARANGIPVVALNIQKEITQKVAKGGLDSLSPAELKEIPATMDMSNVKYRKELAEIFEMHPQGIDFENFYQAQILWDESMARSVAEFLKEKPGYQMIVMAGMGHIMNGYGIPDRFARRTGKKYVTFVNGAYDRDIADYVLFPEPQAPPVSARLGVILKKGAVIADFTPGSPALKAGLHKGDRIISIDDWKVASVPDAKIALFDKVPGQTVSVKAVRKRFLIGSTEITVKVTF